MNSEQEKINAAWSRGAKHYNDIIDDEMNSFRPTAWKKQILGNAPDSDRLKVLDCGCGPGFFSLILAEEGHEVCAVDGSEEMVKFARLRAEQEGLSISFSVADCHELPFGDNSFDLIVSRNVTHALRDHKAVYSQWLRVLKPGGILQIFDANWHLSRPGGRFYEESRERRKKCLEIYGDDFSGRRKSSDDLDKDDESSRSEATVWEHVLKDKFRPDWDMGLLEGIGFSDVTCDRDVSEKLWDDKEKLIYGNTPMFMIRGVKDFASCERKK
ncbi:MAG: class I SAM-dependent methyltransferase [Syntrophomonadaceae bacterium]|nr:class I SAM-dependent methyltransferase [Syntrophomonadaceae bacterium]